MRRLRVTLRTVSPVAPGYRAAYRRQFLESLDYLPGRTWRGALAMGILGRFGCTPGEACGHTACPLHRGGVCHFPTVFLGPSAALFTNLYPGAGTVLHCAPAPLSTRTCKRAPGSAAGRQAALSSCDPLKAPEARARLEASPEPHGLFDGVLPALRGTALQTCPHSDCGEDLTDLRGFVQLGYSPGGALVASQPAVRMARQTHVALNRRSRTAEEGRLYTVAAIDEGQDFSGYLTLPDDDWPAGLSEGLEAGLEEFLGPVGGGLSRGLGEVSVAAVRAQYQGLPPLAERLQAFAAAPGDGAAVRFTLTLVSDAVLRDSGRNLGLWPGFVAARLQELSGQALAVEADHHFHRGGLVSGWDLQHDAPRERAVATVAGSVAVCRVTCADEGEHAALVQALERLELLGIGERRSEGLGQVVVCHPLHSGLVAP